MDTTTSKHAKALGDLLSKIFFDHRQCHVDSSGRPYAVRVNSIKVAESR